MYSGSIVGSIVRASLWILWKNITLSQLCTPLLQSENIETWIRQTVNNENIKNSIFRKSEFSCYFGSLAVQWRLPTEANCNARRWILPAFVRPCFSAVSNFRREPLNSKYTSPLLISWNSNVSGMRIHSSMRTCSMRFISDTRHLSKVIEHILIVALSMWERQEENKKKRKE